MEQQQTKDEQARRRTGRAAQKADSSAPPRKAQHASPSPPSSDLPRVGRTFDGRTFDVPKTWGPMTVRAPWKWSLLEAAQKLSVLNLLLVLAPVPRWVLAAWFLLWRLAYNLGVGLVLRWQSSSQGVTKLAASVARKGPKSSAYRALRAVAENGMGPDYKFETAPMAFTAWLPFRYFVDIVLANDLMAYFAFVLSFLVLPSSLSARDVVFCAVGLTLCVFSLWAKSDSYRVVKDYAWYWGDFFFLIDAKLTFDRVFRIAPHPMYTIGYSFFYGCALLTRSPTVLYVSVAAHFMQMIFLAMFETPHMKKIYPELVGDGQNLRYSLLYDPEIGYFNKDMLGWKNFNPYRISDIAVVVVVTQTVLFHLLADVGPYVYIAEVVVWRLLHTGLLGFVLHKQSLEQFFVRRNAVFGYTKRQAFDNWKGLFNLTHTMTVVSFVMCAFELQRIAFGNFFVEQTLGLLLCAVGWWCYSSCYEVLGDYGWFYGDFFIDDLDIPSELFYHGIYRFMDNPDMAIGFSWWYGVGLLVESRVMLVLALFSQLCHLAFVIFVERPHMRKLYGDKIRPKNGITSAVQEILNYEI